jgi:heme/copper-type cytochrome/quinol oxidase subunit 2
MRIILNLKEPLPMSRRPFSATVAFASLAFLAATICPSLSWGADQATELRYRGGRFEPSSVTLPANTPVKLQVTNASDAAIEFESFELHRERVVQPGQTITVFIPALAPGSYPFFNDLNRAEAKGEIVSR